VRQLAQFKGSAIFLLIILETYTCSRYHRSPSFSDPPLIAAYVYLIQLLIALLSPEALVYYPYVMCVVLGIQISRHGIEKSPEKFITGDAFTTVTLVLTYYNCLSNKRKERAMITILVYQAIVISINYNHYGALDIGTLIEMAF